MIMSYDEEAPLIIPKRRKLFEFPTFETSEDEEGGILELFKFLFPRLYALLTIIRQLVRRKTRPRFRVTRIDRTETGGWEITEVEY